MRAKLLIIFILAILIPTGLLAYFGLRAVRSEKRIVEENIQERYRAMADIIQGAISANLADMPEGLAGNREYVESIVLGEAVIFKNEVKILDRAGREVRGRGRSFTADMQGAEKPVLLRQLAGLPYTIAVYERHPLFILKLEQRKKGLYLYMALIAFSALAILCGGFFTFNALFREWSLTELKSEFVAHLSHDLRRPLTSIRMFSEMLKEGRLPSEDKKQHYYGIITDESERLTHLANNILDFARIERGRKKYDLKSENITHLVRDTVGHFKAHMGEKERKIGLNIEDNIPMLKMDGSAISQALTNLLTNADKFSLPDREITVNMKKGKREVIIEVIDRGVGIRRNDQKKVFDKFYRTSQKEIAETDGSGLGLTLVKYIAKAHKGRVRVESEEGKGSKFSLVLPV